MFEEDNKKTRWSYLSIPSTEEEKKTFSEPEQSTLTEEHNLTVNKKNFILKNLNTGFPVEARLVISNNGNEVLRGIIESDRPWLHVSKTNLNLSGKSKEVINFTVETLRWSKRFNDIGTLTIQTNSGTEKVIVKVSGLTEKAALTIFRMLFIPLTSLIGVSILFFIGLIRNTESYQSLFNQIKNLEFPSLLLNGIAILLVMGVLFSSSFILFFLTSILVGVVFWNFPVSLSPTINLILRGAYISTIFGFLFSGSLFNYQSRLRKSMLRVFLLILLLTTLTSYSFGAGHLNLELLENIKKFKPIESINQFILNTSPSLEVLEQSSSHLKVKFSSTISMKVDLSFEGRCWVKVISDGEKVVEKIFSSGESFSINSEKKVEIRFGAPEQVDVTVNGKSLREVSKNIPMYLILLR